MSELYTQWFPRDPDLWGSPSPAPIDGGPTLREALGDGTTFEFLLRQNFSAREPGVPDRWVRVRVLDDAFGRLDDADQPE